MDKEKDIDEELEKLRKTRETLKSLCNKLEKYDQRVLLHNKAIKELQDVVVEDRDKIIVLLKKVEKMEQKYSSDVMYQ